MSTPIPDRIDAEEPFVQLLTPAGERVTHPDFAYGGDLDDIRGLYRDLVLARRIDTEAFALQRHGELGLWPPSLGQEAAQIGSGRALRPQDFAFPSYREHGVAWCRGIDPVQLLGMFRGSEMSGWDAAEHGYGPPSIVIGAQVLHATGYAMGLQLDGVVGTGDAERDAAVIAYFGDGATSQGDTNEAFDWAAVHHAPVVFFCQNNQYAISAPVARQSRVPIVRRAEGFGFRGLRVDGNDVLACHAVTSAALQVARGGGGPVLVEAVTYRMGAHTTSDDPSRYRDASEVEAWRAKDPLDRVRRHLEAQGTASSFFEGLDTEAEALGTRLREVCRALPEPVLADQFDRVFVETPPDLVAHREEHLAFRASFEEVVA